MEQWVRLCSTEDAPQVGEIREVQAAGKAICLANVNSRLRAVGNPCPHRGAPLAQGWLDGNSIVCPLHSWTFDLDTGIAREPECARVTVFPLRREGEDLIVDIG